jgi:hypothetical protein
VRCWRSSVVDSLPRSSTSSTAAISSTRSRTIDRGVLVCSHEQRSELRGQHVTKIHCAGCTS